MIHADDRWEVRKPVASRSSTSMISSASSGARSCRVLGRESSGSREARVTFGGRVVPGLSPCHLAPACRTWPITNHPHSRTSGVATIAGIRRGTAMAPHPADHSRGADNSRGGERFRGSLRAPVTAAATPITGSPFRKCLDSSMYEVKAAAAAGSRGRTQCVPPGPADVQGIRASRVGRFMTNDAARVSVTAPWPMAYFRGAAT